jgi:hypothetical protein
MKRILGILTILCVFGLTTAAVVQSAPTSKEGGPVVKGTLLEIDGPFYVFMDSTGKEQRGYVDKSTMIIGDVQPGSKVIAVVTKEGHASAIREGGS